MVERRDNPSGKDDALPVDFFLPRNGREGTGPGRSWASPANGSGAGGPRPPKNEAVAGRTTSGLPRRVRQRAKGPAPGFGGAVADSELVSRARGGDGTAYEELYRRHSDAVRRYARNCCRDQHTAEDLTGEVFARALQAIRGGSGPHIAVRGYLLTTVRRVAAAWAKSAKREQLVEDFAAFAAMAANSAPARAVNTGLGAAADVRAMEAAERSMAVRAFRSLPERWQAVLWHTAVERESPSQVAPLLGLTANATAVLAHRAREGLRQAYLQAHVSKALTDQAECGRYADRLGAYARGGLRTRADRELRAHLDTCDRCRAAYVELADVNACLRGVLPVALIGWYAASYATAAVPAAAGAVAGAAAGAAGATTAGTGSGAAAGAGTAAGSHSGLLDSLTGVFNTPAKIALGAGTAATAAVLVLGLSITDLDQGGGQRAKSPASAPAVIPAPPDGSPKPRPEPPDSERTTSPPPSGSAKKPLSPPAERSEPQLPPYVPSPQVFALKYLRFGGVVGEDSVPTYRLGRSGPVEPRESVSIGDTEFRSGGVSVLPPSLVFIDLNRQCSVFDAVVGVDDESSGRSGMRFEVYGSGRLLFRSEKMYKGSQPQRIQVDLDGLNTLQLVVTSEDAGDGRGWHRHGDGHGRADRNGGRRGFHFGKKAKADVADWADSQITC